MQFHRSNSMLEEHYSSPSIVAEAFDCMNPSSKLVKKGKARGKSSKRRFSDDQIRSLESIFESETRLDPQKKVQVASELGLLPRQVAIWFQNKRARWKSKQLEHDYAVLRANYTHLASRLESLKNEKHDLISQLEKLKGLVGKGEAAATTSTDVDQSGEEDETVQLKMEPLAVPAPSLSDDESSIGAAWYLGILEERDQYQHHHHHHHQEDSQSLMISMDTADRGSSLTSTRHGPSLGLHPDELLDPGSPNQWWEFWS